MREILFRSKKTNGDKKMDMTLDELQREELPALINIINFCSTLPISLYSDQTVVKTPEACFRGLYYSKDRLVGEEFLLNHRKNKPDLAMTIGVKAYKSFSVRGAIANRPLLDVEVENESIKLPSPEKLNVPLGPVIQARRSKRNFSGRTITIKELSTLLFYCQGVSGKIDISQGIEGGFSSTRTLGTEYKNNLRNAPSGGGLHPIDLYLLVNGVEKLEKGIYKYMPNSHSLHLVRELQERDTFILLNSLTNFDLFDPSKIRISIVFVYNIYLNSRKYGDSGVAFGLIEAGEIAQDIHLVSNALGLGSCDIGDYQKQKFEKFIGIDGLSKHMIHLVVLGA